jgi:hypothetical protein
MANQARGTFDVQAQREPPYDTAEGATLGRTSFSKQFQGELEGASVVHMLSAVSEVKGSAGYVALERVKASLAGRNGTFVLQHSGTMNRGKAELNVTVVPDSGTHELRGIAGRMAIDIVEGKHFYTFDYTFSNDA